MHPEGSHQKYHPNSSYNIVPSQENNGAFAAAAVLRSLDMGHMGRHGGYEGGSNNKGVIEQQIAEVLP